MPDRNLVSDAALSQALGVYAGMVSGCSGNPNAGLGSMRTRPLRPAYRSGSWTICVIAFSARSHPPHRAGHPCPSRNALIGGSGGSRSAPPSPRRRPGSPAPWLTAYRCRPPSAPHGRARRLCRRARTRDRRPGRLGSAAGPDTVRPRSDRRDARPSAHRRAVRRPVGDRCRRHHGTAQRHGRPRPRCAAGCPYSVAPGPDLPRSPEPVRQASTRRPPRTHAGQTARRRRGRRLARRTLSHPQGSQTNPTTPFLTCRAPASKDRGTPADHWHARLPVGSTVGSYTQQAGKGSSRSALINAPDSGAGGYSCNVDLNATPPTVATLSPRFFAIDQLPMTLRSPPLPPPGPGDPWWWWKKR